MKNLPRISHKVFNEPWAMRRSEYANMCHLLQRHIEEASITAESLLVTHDPDDGAEPYSMFGSVAVVNIHGTIGKRLGMMEMMCGGCDVDMVADALRTAAEDPAAEVIVLDIDSPGGQVTGTPELADLVAEIDGVKPVVAYTETLCCSAAYWIACSARQIVASPSAVVGSIGVICQYEEHSERLEREGVKVMTFKSGELKDTGNMATAMSDEQKDFVQAGIDARFSEFVEQVRSNRSVSEDAFSGGWWSATEAAGMGLVDDFERTASDLVKNLNSAMSSLT